MMMLAYKAWRESRARFVLTAAALGWFSSVFVLFRPMAQAAARRPFADFVIDSIYAGSVRNIFVVLVLALGLGGLTEELARGSAPFTLALPVTRTQLVLSRAATGLLEVLMLALVPTVVVVGLSPFVGETFGMVRAGLYSMQWAVTGSALFAIAFLMSIWLRGAYTALVAAILVVGGYTIAVSVTPLRTFPSLNVFTVMDRAHPSAIRMLGTIAAALTLVALAARATERQDF
jgi:ABC-type transport system involved in multi-copper enzyme maturation permease subunit